MFKNNKKQNPYIDFSKDTDLEHVFKAYYAPLCYYAKSIIGSSFYEDIVSSVFMKFYERKLHFSDQDQFLSYIYTAVKNGCLDHLKTHKRKDQRESLYALAADTYTEIEWQEVVQNEVWAEAYRELKGLPLQCQRVLRLGYFDGLNNEEIANKLKLSVQTVKNHKYRGIQELKKKLVRFSIFMSVFFLF
ncbi:MAG TPA: sigma-70 family RNA polymerase sigma factor [Sphingobacterium sp.]|nr:sigma-70 family RNA polymerase sigma factor [Sphingobacterium sp.]